jgi:hypothetical protein
MQHKQKVKADVLKGREEMKKLLFERSRRNGMSPLSYLSVFLEKLSIHPGYSSDYTTFEGDTIHISFGERLKPSRLPQL